MKSDEKKKYSCYVELGLDLVGGKWKPIIIYYIGLNKVIRFNQLKRTIPNINERMLARQLKELVADKIVKKKDYQQVPPKVEYSLEPAGEAMLGIIESLKRWSMEYNRIHKKAEFLLEDE